MCCKSVCLFFLFCIRNHNQYPCPHGEYVVVNENTMVVFQTEFDKMLAAPKFSRMMNLINTGASNVELQVVLEE